MSNIQSSSAKIDTVAVPIEKLFCNRRVSRLDYEWAVGQRFNRQATFALRNEGVGNAELVTFVNTPEIHRNVDRKIDDRKMRPDPPEPGGTHSYDSAESRGRTCSAQ